MVALAAAAPAASASTGGAPSSPTPVLSDFTCQRACAGVGTARAGSVLQVTGRHLDGVASVVFLGSASQSGDDLSAEPTRASARSLTVKVPRGARTGVLQLVSGDGAASAPSGRALEVVSEGAGDGSGVDARVYGKKVFYGAQQKARLSFLVRESAPVDVGVDLVRTRDGAVVAHWDLPGVAPGTVQSVEWDGTSGGRVQREGRYQFRVVARTPSGTTATSAQAGENPAASPESFVFLRHKFPIRGAHDYGGGGATYGTDRGGRSHQGHDVFARCGTPMVAARGGVVRWKGSHRLAGHYLVIDGDQTGTDYAYMHLQRAAPVDRGDRVYTGQLIGHVGDTGNARGCHLHFEMWSAPGWHRGGSPFDPLPSLRSWDRLS